MNLCAAGVEIENRRQAKLDLMFFGRRGLIPQKIVTFFDMDFTA